MTYQRRPIAQVRLQERHAATGKTRHFVGGSLMRRPTALQINALDEGYALTYLDASGDEITDTFHLTLDGAFAQAEFEFAVTKPEWVLSPTS